MVARGASSFSTPTRLQACRSVRTGTVHRGLLLGCGRSDREVVFVPHQVGVESVNVVRRQRSWQVHGPVRALVSAGLFEHSRSRQCRKCRGVRARLWRRVTGGEGGCDVAATQNSRSPATGSAGCRRTPPTERMRSFAETLAEPAVHGQFHAGGEDVRGVPICIVRDGTSPRLRGAPPYHPAYAELMASSPPTPPSWAGHPSAASSSAANAAAAPASTKPKTAAAPSPSRKASAPWSSPTPAVTTTSKTSTTSTTNCSSPSTT